MARTEVAGQVSPPPWHALDAGVALERLGAEPERGLSTEEARARLARHGPNVLERVRGPRWSTLVWRQLDSPIVFLLLGSAALAAALGKVLDGAVVLGAVVVNALVGFLQELRAGKAIEALARMVPHDAQVIRDGRARALPASELVPGDVVLLAAGDRVPADVRLLSAKSLQVEEAALTGESVPVRKEPAAVAEETPLGDRVGVGFGGTLVTAGSARAVVVATGMATELGRISDLLGEAAELQTPLTRALSSVGKQITLAVLAISAALFGVGYARGYDLPDALMVAVALAVATIPEGLPAIITIALAIGVQRMAARHAVVRKLPSVETLGSTTVICSDKTGTLTRNEMTVRALATPSGAYEVSGVGYAPDGAIASSSGPLEAAPDDVRALLEAGLLCSDASVHLRDGAWQLSGDPTEGALVVAARKAGLDPDALRRTWPRVDELPFEPARRLMATLHEGAGREVRLLLVKGAPEAVLCRCALEEDERERWSEQAAALAARGMRLLAVARKTVPAREPAFAEADLDEGLELLGIEGMIDPPRPEAIEAVRRCLGAGVAVKMITGDHLGTAEAIGRQLGLLEEDGRGLTGAELARLDRAGLRRAAASTHVLARVAPEHKLALVRALQEEGQVVAMTGDGVNDAPALKQADIGVAMGITGTAVSKEAADVVLADDNFASIAAAVEEGRRIYDNLVKSLAFVLPTNLGLGFLLVAAVSFFPVLTIGGDRVPLMPVQPTQLLWINLVAAVALSFPLAFERGEPDAMQRPPRAPGAPILGRFLVVRTVLVALLMAAGAVALFLWEYRVEVGRRGHEVALREAQTMAVTTLVCFQVFYLFNCRSLRGSVLRSGFFSNPVVFVGIGVLLALHAGFIYLPFMQRVFGTAALQPVALLYSALAGSVVLPVIAVEKAIRRRRREGRAR